MPIAFVHGKAYILIPWKSQGIVAPQHFVIAIDGPAASGKSTTARRVAEELKFLHLDTGAMYRAITLKVLQSGIPSQDSEALRRMVEKTSVAFSGQGADAGIFLDGVEVSAKIRSEQVTRTVSAVSSNRFVREAMVREQRRVATYADLVAEGRDIGTVVFPDAQVKFFLVASIEARAHRRMAELEIKGVARDLPRMMQEIQERDRLDSGRDISPLRKADDAIELDTSCLSIEQQVAVVVNTARERLTGKGG